MDPPSVYIIPGRMVATLASGLRRVKTSGSFDGTNTNLPAPDVPWGSPTHITMTAPLNSPGGALA